MIDSGYKETLNYLNMRYHKNELQEYENEEYMYSTFSSLGELLSYCCYRGDKNWFDVVYQLIEESTAPNQSELMKQAEELRVLYFNHPNSVIHGPKHEDNPFTFLVMKGYNLLYVQFDQKIIKFYWLYSLSF